MFSFLTNSNTLYRCLIFASGFKAVGHGPWSMGHEWCRMIKGWGSGWAGLWGWDNRVVENQGRHILCRGCPPFAHPAVARAMGLEPGSLSLATHQRTQVSAQSPRDRILHHEQSCPAAASASADRSSRLLHFLPAPTDTLRPSPRPLPPSANFLLSPQDTQHNVDPTTSHGPGHDPRHKEDSQAQGLWYATRRLRRPPPPPNSPPRWPRTDRDGAPQTQTTRTTRPSTRPTEATSSKGRRDL